MTEETLATGAGTTGANIELEVGELTLGDVTEGLGRLAQDGPTLVIDSGRYGIQLVASQAEDLGEILEAIQGLPSQADESFELAIAGEKGQAWDQLVAEIQLWATIDDVNELMDRIGASA